MPRLKTTGISPNWNQLRATAGEQVGYFSVAQAREAGFGSALLRYHVRTGEFEQSARGTYRLSHYPHSQDDELVPIWLWSGRLGVFSHETALRLKGLTDLLPSSTQLTLPLAEKTRRRKALDNVELYYADVPPEDRTWVGFLPVTRPLRSLEDSAAAGVSPEFIEQGIRQGLARGLFVHEDVRQRLPDYAAIASRPRRSSS